MITQLASIIEKYPEPDHLGPYDPDFGDIDVWKFYLFTIAQMCGTGDNKASCREIWNMYLNSWQSDKVLFSKVDYPTFYDRVIDIIPEDQLAMRFKFHTECVSTSEWRIENAMPTPNGHGFIHPTKAYGHDKYSKKLNLLCNILSCRQDVNYNFQRGPVVDYHVMRVILRYFGNVEASGSLKLDEEIQRSITYQTCKFLIVSFPLSSAMVDNVLWTIGRDTCTVDEPKCSMCPFDNHCMSAYKADNEMFKEARIKTFDY